MLVGRRVNHNLGPVPVKYPAQSLPIGNGADFNLQIQGRTIGNPQLLLHIVGAVFVNIQNHNLAGSHFCQLAAHLRADGSAAAGNQDHLVPIENAGLFIGDNHRLAEQQLLNIKFPQIALAAGGLHHRVVVYLDLVACLNISLVQFPLFVIAEIGYGKDNLLDLMPAKLLHGGFVFHQHGNSVDFSSRLFRTLVHKAPGRIGRVSISQQLFRQVDAHPAGANDGHLDFLPGVAASVNHFLSAKNPQQQPQNPALQRILRSAFEGVTVKHPDCQGPQQIHAGKGQQPGKGDLLNPYKQRQNHFNSQVDQKGNAIYNQQPNIALNAAVTPDLSVDASEIANGKDACEGNTAVQQHTAPGQAVIASVEHQQHHIQKQQNSNIVDDQRPPDFSFCHFVFFLFFPAGRNRPAESRVCAPGEDCRAGLSLEPAAFVWGLPTGGPSNGPYFSLYIIHIFL